MGIFKKILKLTTVLMGIVLGVLVYISIQIDKQADDINQAINKQTSVVDAIEEEAQPIGVLLLGVDSRDGAFNDGDTSGNDTRSDAILYASINPETKTTELVTIPRDTLVEMSKDTGVLDKVNHAYYTGGVDEEINTVANYLDVPIHYYVEINMDGLIDLVDAVGGVTITPTLTFTYEGNEFTEGVEQELNGTQALAYARMRKEDPKGDVGRGERQQQVITAIIDKVVSLNLINNYEDILGVLKGNMKTNAVASLGIIKDYLPATETINKHSVDTFYDYTIDGVYYLGIPEETRVSLSNTLRANLGLTPTSSDMSYINENASQGILSTSINEYSDTYSDTYSDEYSDEYSDTYSDTYSDEIY